MSTMISVHSTEFSRSIALGLGVLITVLFALDLSLPLGVAAGVPYLLAVLWSRELPGRHSTFMIAVLCSGLTVVGYVLSPAGGEEWKVLVNRGLALFAIWATAILSMRWKEAEIELEHRAKNLQSMVDLIPHMIYVRDERGRLIMGNQKTADILGITRDDVISGTHVLGSTNSYEELVRKKAEQKVRQQQVAIVEGEEIVTNARGEKTSFHTTRLPYQTLNSSHRGVLTVALDQTEQRLAQEALLLTKQVFDVSPDHISVVSQEYRYQKVNPAYEKAHGITLEKIEGLHVADLLGEEVFQQVVKPRLDQCLAGEEVTYESWFSFKNNQSHYMVVTYSPLKFHPDVIDGVIVVARDLTDRKHAELELQETRERLEQAIWGSNDGLWDWPDPEKDEEWWSPRFYELLGYADQEFQSSFSKFQELLHPDDREKTREAVRLHFEERIPFDVEHRLQTKLGTYRWFRAKGKLNRDTRGRAVRMAGSIQDIHDKKEIAVALKISEQRLALALEATNSGSWDWNIQTGEVVFGKQWLTSMGYAEHEAHKTVSFWENLVHPEDMPSVQMALQRHFAGEVETYECMNRLRKADGEWRWNLDKGRVLEWDDQGQPLRMVGTDTDITRRVKAEEASQESGRLASSTMEALSAHLCVIDRGGDIVAINKRWRDYAEVNGGWRDELGVGANYLSVCDLAADNGNEDAQCVGAGIRSVLSKQEKEFSYDYACHSPREERWFSCRVTRFPDPGPVRIVIAHEDITTLKLTQATLFNRIQELRDLYNYAPCGYHSLDVSGRYVEVNDTELSWLGFSREELLGSPAMNVLTLASQQQFRKVFPQFLESGTISNLEADYQRKDGTILSVLVNATAVRNDAGEFIRSRATILDITERKHAEEKLRSSQMILKSFFDSAPLMMGMVEIVDDDLRHLSDNVAVGNFFGIDVTELQGRFSREIGVPEKVRQLWVNSYRQAHQLRSPVHFEYEHRQEIQTYWLSATVSYIDSSLAGLPRFAYVVEDITTRKHMEQELRRYTDGLEAEVTRRSHRIQELEQRRMQVEKLAALAQVAAGVAHEINNPLASIAQSMVLLRRAIPSQHQHFHYADKIQDCIDRISHIVKQLFQLYRPDSGTEENVNVGEVVNVAIGIMTSSAEKRSVNLVSRVDRSVTDVKLSRVNLTQIFCNLIQNALDASQAGQTVLLDMTFDKEEGMTVSVHDDGAGIGSEDQVHIFEPFFTTKHGSPESGMGLGLAVSQSLAESMGCSIAFTSIEGQGSTFSVNFPKE